MIVTNTGKMSHISVIVFQNRLLCQSNFYFRQNNIDYYVFHGNMLDAADVYR